MKILKKLVVNFKGFKSWFKRRSLKSRWLLGVSAIIFALVIYLVVAILTLSQAELNLLKLKNSLANEKICHEPCRSNRENQREKIALALSLGDEHLEKKLLKYFFEAEESQEFKKELLKIWRQSSMSPEPPSALTEYLEDPNGDPELQALIIKSWLAENLTNPPLDYYFSLLFSPADLILKKEAIAALSNLPDKKQYFTLAQLGEIKKIVLNPGSAKELRQPLVLLLADYYLLFQDETDEILAAVYQNNNLADNISRAFSADILNRAGGLVKFPLPEISEQEWGEYYNN